MSLNRCVAGQLFNCSDYNEALDAIEHQDYNYVVFKDAGEYHAKNGHTGIIEYSDPSFSTVMNTLYTVELTSGGLIYLLQETYEVDAPLTPTNDTYTWGCGFSTRLEVQSDIDCFRLVGTGAADLVEHVHIEHLKIYPKGGVVSSNAGIYLQYVGNVTINDVAIDLMNMGVEGPPTFNVITQCNFFDVDCWMCNYGFHLHLTFDCRFRDCLINSPQADRHAAPFGGVGFGIIGGAGGDVIEGLMVLQGEGGGFYFENSEWTIINNCVADDCNGHGWTFTDTTGSSILKGLQINNCWAGSCGLDTHGGGVNQWDGAVGFFFEDITEACVGVALQARSNANTGIFLDTCTDIKLVAPICMDNSKLHGAPAYDKHGVELHECEYVSIIGGRMGNLDPVTQTQDYGIFEDTDSTNNIYVDVDVRGNLTGGVNVIGPETHVIRCEGWSPPGYTVNCFDPVAGFIWLVGTTNVPVASTDYEVGTADIILSSGASGGDPCAIMVKDPNGNNVLVATQATIDHIYIPKGYVVNWGAFTGAAPNVRISFN